MSYLTSNARKPVHGTTEGIQWSDGKGYGWAFSVLGYDLKSPEEFPEKIELQSHTTSRVMIFERIEVTLMDEVGNTEEYEARYLSAHPHPYLELTIHMYSINDDSQVNYLP